MTVKTVARIVSEAFVAKRCLTPDVEWREGEEMRRLCRKVDGNNLLSTIDSIFYVSSFQYVVWFVNFATEPFLLIVNFLFWEAVQQLAQNRMDLTTKEFYELNNGIRTTLVQALGGATLLIGLFFTGRNLRISQEGQITDRFTKAINQLGESGPEKLAIRLGGIYALERIARDSEKDHGPIIEVLTASVRENAPRQEETPSRQELPREGQPREKTLSRKPAGDIQAILTVLGRRRRTFRKREELHLDLNKTDLRGAALSKANLSGIDFGAADLCQVSFSMADLRGADCGIGNLRTADFRRASLSKAQFIGADLRGADFSKARLMGADFTGATLIGANFRQANLAWANFNGADLTGANLPRAKLLFATLRHVRGLTEERLAEAITTKKTP